MYRFEFKKPPSCGFDYEIQWCNSTYILCTWKKVFIRLTWIEMRNWLHFVIHRISIVIFFNCPCLICLSLSSSFFILMNIDDLGIGGSVHNLGRGDMRVLGTSWTACNRQQEFGSKHLFSYFFLCTGQHANGFKRSDVLPCRLRMLNA